MDQICLPVACRQGSAMNDSEIGARTPDNAPRLDTGLASLVMLARFHQVAASPEQLAHEFGSPDQCLSQDSLLLAARKLGLKAKAAKTTTERLDRTPLPAIA
ncbi:hypothetical protein ALQ90_05359, partial [Pseudomonas savastanoi pv. savastanoi]